MNPDDVKNHGGNAFPADPFLASRPGNEAVAKRIAEGMSLRDYFAAKALAWYSGHPALDDVNRKGCAEACYAMADAMLRAREA